MFPRCHFAPSHFAPSHFPGPTVVVVVPGVVLTVDIDMLVTRMRDRAMRVPRVVDRYLEVSNRDVH